MSKSRQYSPTRAEIIGALPHIRYEIEALLLTPAHDHRDESIVETVYLRKMTHARALHTFFTTPLAKGQSDDVLSEEYLFPSASIFPDAEKQARLDRFNKDLFHISYTRVKRNTSDKAWPMRDLLPPVMDRAKKFITHIVNLGWTDIPEAELQKWRQMQDQKFVFLKLQQNTSNIAGSQVNSIEVHVKGKEP